MATFDYRRELTRTETLRALAAGAGVGLAAAAVGAYLARVLMQRAPVVNGPAGPVEPAAPPRRARR